MAAATLVGIRLGQGAEDRRLSLSDRQRLRDIKAERLRRLYEPLLKFGLYLQQAVREKGYTMAGETVEDRDRRHEKELSEGMYQVSQVIASVIMEPETDRVLAAYDAAYGAADQYLRSWRMITTGLEQGNATRHTEQAAEVQTTSKALQGAVKEQLTELERPIVIPPRRWWELW